MRAVVLFTLGVVLACVLAAQQPSDQQDVSDILQKVAATYAAINDYIITVTRERFGGSTPIRDDGVIAQNTGESGGGSPLAVYGAEGKDIGPTAVVQSPPFLYDWGSPGKMVLARSGSSFHFERGGPDYKNKVIWITNGQTTWHYGPVRRKYTELPARPWPKVAGPGLGLPGYEWLYFTKFRALGEMANRARLISTHAKSDLACPGPTTEIELQVGTAAEKKTELLWILNANNLVCESKVEYQTGKNGGQFAMITTTWRYDQLSGPINPNLFAFDPPKGAKKVGSFNNY